MKTFGAIASLIGALLVFRAINDVYCAWNPDTLIGKAVKWTQWDGRRC